MAVYVEGPRSSTEHEDDLRHLWSVQVFLPAMRFHYSVRVVFCPSRVRVRQDIPSSSRVASTSTLLYPVSVKQGTEW